MYIKLSKYIIKISTFILLCAILQNLNLKMYVVANALSIEKKERLVVSNYKVPNLISPSKGRVTSNFGARKSGKHHGIDIAANMGAPIRASYKGIVSKVDYHDIYGKRIIINHGNGIETLYAHCNNIFVKVGEKVTSGQHIANIGSTGKSTGPHIHFELRVNGKAINPISYIK